MLLAGSFLAMWAGLTLVLSSFRWFQRKLSLIERLTPHLAEKQNWVDDVEAWLKTNSATP